MTIEVVGEFLGLDTESSMFTHFCRYYADWFPGLWQINRTTFTRQATNLWKIKPDWWQEISRQIPHDPYLSIVDSFPVPVCRFARAKWCRTFGEVAAFDYDEVAHQTYYGLRAHVRLAWPGVLMDCTVAPAPIPDTEGTEELLKQVCGYILADRNYWKPELFGHFKANGLWLLAPYRSAKREKQPRLRRLNHMRYRIKTVFEQLVERFYAKRI